MPANSSSNGARIQAVLLRWHPVFLAARDLSAPGLSPDFLLRRFRAPRAASTAAQFRSLAEARGHLRPRRPRTGDVHPSGLGIRRAFGNARSREYDQPDHAHHQRRSARRYSRTAAPTNFCWVARKADAEVIERIRALNLQGIHFQKEPKRFYPKRELAAQVLGYVGTDDQGLSGLERQFNQQLQGKPGKLMISVDARKRWYCQRREGAGARRQPRSDDRSEHPVHRGARTAARHGRDACDRRHSNRGESAHRAKFWRSPTGQRSIRITARKLKRSAQRPRCERHLRARFNF